MMMWRGVTSPHGPRLCQGLAGAGVPQGDGDMIKVADMGELMSAVEAVPLFPLPGTVFIPHTMLPLHVFEPRYRALIADAVAGNGYLAVPRLKPGWEQGYEGRPPVFTHAGFGKIVRHDPLPDGRANIVLLGLGRIKIRQELARDKPYRVAQGDLLTDEFPDGGRASIEAAVRRLRVMLAQVVSGRPQLAERVSPLLNGEMGGGAIRERSLSSAVAGRGCARSLRRDAACRRANRNRGDPAGGSTRRRGRPSLMRCPSC